MHEEEVSRITHKVIVHYPEVNLNTDTYQIIKYMK